MLNVALAGLLASSLLTSPVGDDDDKKKKNAEAEQARVEAEAPAEALFTRSTVTAPAERAITQDTYAFGAPSDIAPIKLWASYAYGESESLWDAGGETAEYMGPVVGASDTGTPQRLFTSGDIVTQRANFGAQLNLINFPAFKLGGGAQLTLAKNELQFGSDNAGVLAIDGNKLETDFELQNVKVFGSLRGRVLGLHGGYIFDIASESDPIGGTITTNLPTAGGLVPFTGSPSDLAALAGQEPGTFGVSDQRDAIFFGADFDVSGPVFRAFGGADYFLLQDPSDLGANDDNDDFVNFVLGGGVRLSIFEIGAAAQIQTRLGQPLVSPSVGTTEGVGGHAGTISPYLRISPSGLPASIFVKGAVQDEYTEYGYAIGGANAPKPSIGFTAGLAVGFE